MKVFSRKGRGEGCLLLKRLFVGNFPGEDEVKLFSGVVALVEIAAKLSEMRQLEVAMGLF